MENGAPGCRLGASELGLLHHGVRFQLLVLGGATFLTITKHFRYLKWRDSEPYFWLFWGWVFPYISRIHTACIGEYLHFRYLKCLVIQGCPRADPYKWSAMVMSFHPEISGVISAPTWMSRWKLGSMVSKWVITPIYLPFISRL